MNKLQLTKEQITQLVAGLVFGALFIYVYVVYFWMPLSKKIQANTKKIATIEADIAKAKSQKAKYKDLEAKLLSLTSEKESAQKRLPKERKLPDLLKTLTTMSKKYNVEIVSIAPSGNTKEGYFIKAAYGINLKGDYHSLGRFLTALALEERILTMENLNVSGTIGSETSLAASFILMAYQYNG